MHGVVAYTVLMLQPCTGNLRLMLDDMNCLAQHLVHKASLASFYSEPPFKLSASWLNRWTYVRLTVLNASIYLSIQFPEIISYQPLLRSPSKACEITQTSLVQTSVSAMDSNAIYGVPVPMMIESLKASLYISRSIYHSERQKRCLELFVVRENNIYDFLRIIPVKVQAMANESDGHTSMRD